MKKMVNKVDKLMPEMHLRRTGYPCSACGLFAKNK